MHNSTCASTVYGNMQPGGPVGYNSEMTSGAGVPAGAGQQLQKPPKIPSLKAKIY